MKNEENLTGNAESKNKEEYYGFDLFPDRRNESDPSWMSRWFGSHRDKDRERYLCERRVLKAVKTHPLVRLLMNALESSGCPVELPRNVSCEVCDRKVTGGYDADFNQIVICQNSYKASHYPEITLVHELVHMFDNCVNNVDFKNLDHLACTEIRAANLSHCSFLSSFFLSQSTPFNIKNTHQYCVKMKAAQSLMVSRNLDFDTAIKTVLKVFDKCYNDMEPIGRRIRRNSNEAYMSYREGLYYGYGDRITEDYVKE